MRAKKSPHPAVAGLPNKDSGVRHWGCLLYTSGERRWRAAKLAGLKEVPVVIKDYSPQEIMEVALIENIQREDLNPVEEAKAYQNLIKEYNLKQEEVAERVSKSRSAITNSLRLLKLSDGVLTLLMEEEISSGHARACLLYTSRCV